MKLIPSCHDVSKSDDTRSPTSLDFNSGPICRICHEGESKEELVSPCFCTGSMALVHRECLEKWLSSSNHDTCEICKFQFVTFRQPLPFREWILGRTSQNDFRNLIGDIICFCLLTPLATVSCYLCFIGARSNASKNVKWESNGLICLSIILIAIYLTWCTITIRYHYQNWRLWRVSHQAVHLVQVRRISESDYPDNQITSSGLSAPIGLEMTTFVATNNNSAHSYRLTSDTCTSTPNDIVVTRASYACCCKNATQTSFNPSNNQCLLPLMPNLAQHEDDSSSM